MKINEMTVNEIREFIKKCDSSLGEGEKSILSQDPREGVRKLYQQCCRLESLADKERLRLKHLRIYEDDANRQGFNLIAGVDEAGRGPLAGPVVAAAVIMPKGLDITGIDDSKKLSPAKREKLSREIKEQALCWSVGISSVQEIDSINILRASLLAMQRAVTALKLVPDYILVDALTIPGLKTPQLPIIKGDGKSISIAAASIIAKVTRDKMMETIDREFPNYGFARHKGYGTADHLDALKKHGLCPLHRKTFTKSLKTADINGRLW